ncbi:MAG: class I SAM-dependent methyltransferase [Kangiellaceae bacterium]|nr:class I SAM-dependent methyltransferase [Kangiellaceae bacterium]
MSEKSERFNTYDVFADIYDRFWGERCLAMLPAIEMFVLSKVSEQGKILDLCCGTGQMAASLLHKGYSVTGIDGSAEMISLAKNRAAEAEFIVSDIRDFSVTEQHDGAVSLLDSLNHIMSLDSLIKVFSNVNCALKPGAPFFFDLRMEEGFRYYWGGEDHEELPNIIEEDLVFVPKSSYDQKNRIGHSHCAIFRRQDNWQRYDLKVDERYYSSEEIKAALTQTGFSLVQSLRAKEDLKMDVVGRSLFFCVKK